MSLIGRLELKCQHLPYISAGNALLAQCDDMVVMKMQNSASLVDKYLSAVDVIKVE